MNYKRWSFFTIASVLATLLAVILFNYYVDPYQIFKKHTYGFLEKSRYQNAGLINSYLNSEDGYDSLIIGSSMTQNFISTDVDKTLGWSKTLKLSMSGASPKSQYTVLNYALKTGKVKHVLWAIDDSFTTRTPDTEEQSKSMPYFLYESKYTLESVKKYLLNSDILSTSVKTLIGNEEYKNSIDEIGYWMDKKKSKKEYINFNKDTNIIQLQNNLKADKYTYKYTDDFPAIDLYITKLIKKYPNIQFTIFFSPYSAYNFMSQNELYKNRNISMRRYLLNSISANTNISLYAFDTADFTSELINYKDSKHYTAKINHKILEHIKEKSFMLNHENISDYEKVFVGRINRNSVSSSTNNLR